MVEQSSQPSQNQSKFTFLFPWFKTPTPKPPITPNEPKPIVTIIPILSFAHHTQEPSPQPHTPSQTESQPRSPSRTTPNSPPDVETPLSPDDATAQPPIQQEENQTVSQPPSEQNSSTSQSEPQHNEDQDQPPSAEPLTQDHQLQVESSPQPLLKPQNESQTQELNVVTTKPSQESDPETKGASVSHPTNNIIPSQLLQDLPEPTFSQPGPSLGLPGTKPQPFSEPNTAHQSKVESQPILPPHIEKQPQQASQEVSMSPSATYVNSQPSQTPSPQTSQLQLPQPFTQSAQTSEPQSMPQNLPLPIGSAAHSQSPESPHPKSTEARHSLPSDATSGPQPQLQPQLAIQAQPESREARPGIPSKTNPHLHPIKSSKPSSPPSQPAESQPTVPHYSSQSTQRTFSQPDPSLDLPATKPRPFSSPNTAHQSKADSQPTLPPPSLDPLASASPQSPLPSPTQYANPPPETSSQPPPTLSHMRPPQNPNQQVPSSITQSQPALDGNSQPPSPSFKESRPQRVNRLFSDLSSPSISQRSNEAPTDPRKTQEQPSKVFNSMEQGPRASIASPVHPNPIDTTQSYTKQETEPQEEEIPQIQTDEKTKQKISTELHMEPQPNQQIKPHSDITSSAEPKHWKKQKIGDEETETRGTTGFKFAPTACRQDQTTNSASHTKFSVSVRELDSLYKEMKEDLSGLAHKLVMGQTDQQLDAPSSAMVLVGKSKGAIMHIRLDMEENDGLSNTDENPGQPTCINSNIQTVNNSILCNSSFQERNPGAHLAFSFTE